MTSNISRPKGQNEASAETTDKKKHPGLVGCQVKGVSNRRHKRYMKRRCNNVKKSPGEIKTDTKE